MLNAMVPPPNPQEAIKGRRNPSYGFTIIADMMAHSALVALFDETRDAILTIIDPNRATKPRPVRSSLYIKQTFFHASLFGSQPLLDQQQFVDIYAGEHGLLTHETMNTMCETLHAHLQEQKPYLEPIGYELIPRDGTLVARFFYKTDTSDETPLLTLTSQLDPDKKFTTWDAGKTQRFTTIAVSICVIDIDKMSHQLGAIKAQLDLASRKLRELNRLEINRFQLISAYDKRTLSLKHISMYASIELERINRLTRTSSGSPCV